MIPSDFIALSFTVKVWISKRRQRLSTLCLYGNVSCLSLVQLKHKSVDVIRKGSPWGGLRLSGGSRVMSMKPSSTPPPPFNLLDPPLVLPSAPTRSTESPPGIKRGGKAMSKFVFDYLSWKVSETLMLLVSMHHISFHLSAGKQKVMEQLFSCEMCFGCVRFRKSFVPVSARF